MHHNEKMNRSQIWHERYYLAQRRHLEEVRKLTIQQHGFEAMWLIPNCPVVIKKKKKKFKKNLKKNLKKKVSQVNWRLRTRAYKKNFEGWDRSTYRKPTTTTPSISEQGISRPCSAPKLQTKGSRQTFLLIRLVKLLMPYSIRVGLELRHREDLEPVIP